MLSEKEVSAAAVCLRRGGLEVKRKCERLLTTLAVPLQIENGVVIGGCGAGRTEEVSSSSSSKENQSEIGTKHRKQGRTGRPPE